MPFDPSLYRLTNNGKIYYKHKLDAISNEELIKLDIDNIYAIVHLYLETHPGLDPKQVIADKVIGFIGGYISLKEPPNITSVEFALFKSIDLFQTLLIPGEVFKDDQARMIRDVENIYEHFKAPHTKSLSDTYSVSSSNIQLSNHDQFAAKMPVTESFILNFLSSQNSVEKHKIVPSIKSTNKDGERKNAIFSLGNSRYTYETTKQLRVINKLHVNKDNYLETLGIDKNIEMLISNIILHSSLIKAKEDVSTEQNITPPPTSLTPIEDARNIERAEAPPPSDQEGSILQQPSPINNVATSTIETTPTNNSIITPPSTTPTGLTSRLLGLFGSCCREE